MRNHLYVNQVKAIEWRLTIQEAHIFSFCYELPSWADKIIVNNEIYYFAARQKAVEELPILTDKPDTIYRNYKKLENKGLIIYKKHNNKDVIRLTKKGQDWNKAEPGFKFESEFKLKSTRFQTRNDSDSNSIDSNTNDSNTNDSIIEQVPLFEDQKKEKKKKFIPPTLQEVIEYFKKNSQTEQRAKKAFSHYNDDSADWHDSAGKKVFNWKQKMRTVWFKDPEPGNQRHTLKNIEY